VLKEPKNGGDSCPVLTTIRECDPPVDCVVSDPVVYNPCNYSNQSQTKTSVIIKAPKNGGTACGPLTKTQSCTTSGPYVYTTQVFAGQSIPMTVTSNFVTGWGNVITRSNTIFSQSGIPDAWGPVNFTSYGGLCVIDLNFTAYTKSANNVGTFALIIDGVAQLPLIKFCFNQPDVHCTVPGVYLSLYLSPGVHTIGLYVNYITTNFPVSVDNNDFIWLRVIEYSQALVAGPNPSVYVTTLFNQISSGASSYNEQGIPPNWKKTAITHGGQCMIDLNFSAFNKNANEGVNFALMIDGEVKYPLIYYNFSIPSKHQTITASFTTQALDPGTHTFAIYISWGGSSGTTVDPWDYLNMRITEFNYNLTMSTPKLINVIPLLSMTQPTTSSSPSEASPNKWTGNFVTNGGSCAFNISNTFVSTSYLGVAHIIFIITNADNSAINSTIIQDDNNFRSSQKWFITSGKMRIINYYCISNVNEHVSVNCNFIITGLPAGSHTFYGLLQSHPSVVVCDPTDTLNVRLIEFSRTLTSGDLPEAPAPFSADNPRPNFQGCYNDNVNNERAFNNMVDNQSLAQCNTIAKTVESPYFGMQNWQKAGGITSMDTGECWFQKGSTLKSAESQGSSTNCSIGPGRYTIGGSNTNAVYKTS
jgi:hypothetical protein